MINMKPIFSGIAISALTISANAATVFQPTDTNINFFDWGLDGGEIAIFEDTDIGFTGNHLVITPFWTDVAFTANGSDFNVTAHGNTALSLLIGSNAFILGYKADSGSSWEGDTNSVAYQNSETAFVVNFGDNVTFGVDLQPVPVPAAAWLFGTGLLGLAGVSRRKRTT